jgi:hypothetical protein
MYNINEIFEEDLTLEAPEKVLARHQALAEEEIILQCSTAQGITAMFFDERIELTHEHGTLIEDAETAWMIFKDDCPGWLEGCHAMLFSLEEMSPQELLALRESLTAEVNEVEYA